MDAASISSHGLPIVSARRLDSIEFPVGFAHAPSVTITRDFSDFPFQLAELTEDECRDSRFRSCLKFQVTDEYVAYVPSQFQNYIKAEHLLVEREPVAMAEARRSFWGNTSDVEKARYRLTHSQEYAKLDRLWDELNFKHTRDHESSYARVAGGAFVSKLRKIDTEQAANFHLLKTKNMVATVVMLSVLFLIFWQGEAND